MCLELQVTSVHLFFSFKLIQLKGEDVLGVHYSQRNKTLHPIFFYFASVVLGEFDSIFRMVPSGV